MLQHATKCDVSVRRSRCCMAGLTCLVDGLLGCSRDKDVAFKLECISTLSAQTKRPSNTIASYCALREKTVGALSICCAPGKPLSERVLLKCSCSALICHTSLLTDETTQLRRTATAKTYRQGKDVPPGLRKLHSHNPTSMPQLSLPNVTRKLQYSTYSKHQSKWHAK